MEHLQLYVKNQSLDANVWYDVSELGQLQITWDPRVRSHYTLIMYDIDAPYPNAPTNSPFVHILVTDIPGNEINRGVQKFPYTLPSPPANSPAHRYIIALYHRGRQTHSIQEKDYQKMTQSSFPNRGAQMVINFLPYN